jgi:hypothetical protein
MMSLLSRSSFGVHSAQPEPPHVPEYRRHKADCKGNEHCKSHLQAGVITLLRASSHFQQTALDSLHFIYMGPDRLHLLGAGPYHRRAYDGLDTFRDAENDQRVHECKAPRHILFERDEQVVMLGVVFRECLELPELLIGLGEQLVVSRPGTL